MPIARVEYSGRVKLVALHGYSLNGRAMLAQLDGVRRALPTLELIAPDAPNPCPADAVDRLYAVWQAPRQPPPHFIWFDASDDGREYRGWEATRERLSSLIGGGPVGLLGFSQGAIVATALAAMRELPISFAILVAGRPPRADVLRPFLTRPIEVPSLHVWGERDALVGDQPRALVDLYSPTGREVVTWPGEHAIPESGPALEAIIDFVERSSDP